MEIYLEVGFRPAEFDKMPEINKKLISEGWRLIESKEYSSKGFGGITLTSSIRNTYSRIM